MKIGLFTDSHYSSQEITCGVRRNRESLRKIREAYRFFEEKGCGLVICLGDLTDAEEDHSEEIRHLQEAADVIAASPIETVCVMGNHDGFAFYEEEFYRILGEVRRPSTRVYSGCKLLFPDACYLASGRHYAPGDTDWTDTYFPHVEWLERELTGWDGEAVLFLHQTLDPNVPEHSRVKNDREIRAILEKSGRVKRVFQGHHHPGGDTVWNGIRYRTLPALCEGEGVFFVEEI